MYLHFPSLLSEVHDVVQVQSTLQICPGIGSRRRMALGRSGRVGDPWFISTSAWQKLRNRDWFGSPEHSRPPEMENVTPPLLKALKLQSCETNIASTGWGAEPGCRSGRPFHHLAKKPPKRRLDMGEYSSQ